MKLKINEKSFYWKISRTRLNCYIINLQGQEEHILYEKNSNAYFQSTIGFYIYGWYFKCHPYKCHGA